MAEKVNVADFKQVLANLQDIAKSNAPSLKVPAMAGESGATQVFHTPSDSDPGEFAGTKNEEVPGNGDHDPVDANGTDLIIRAKISKSIYAKLAKGQGLTAAQLDFVAKGMMIAKDEKEIEKAHDDEAEDKQLFGAMMKKEAKKDEKKDEAKKSFNEAAAGYDSIREGFEVSDVLKDLAKAISEGFDGSEEKIVGRVVKSLGSKINEQGEFNKSLAQALSNLGEVMVAHAQRLDQVEAAPTRGPKSTRVVPLEKSFGASADQGSPLSIVDVTNTLSDMVVKGLARPEEVVHVDTTKRASDEIIKRVQDFRARR